MFNQDLTVSLSKSISEKVRFQHSYLNYMKTLYFIWIEMILKKHFYCFKKRRF